MYVFRSPRLDGLFNRRHCLSYGHGDSSEGEFVSELLLDSWLESDDTVLVTMAGFFYADLCHLS